MMPVVILCGGLGTRLGELTKDRPKSLVPVNGEPFLLHQLRLLRVAGVEDVFLIVHHLGHQLVTGWDRSLVRPMRVHVVHSEYAIPLGTAGAIRMAVPWLPRYFFTLYGDAYLECDYEAIEQEFHERGKLGLMTEWEGIDYGLSAFARAVFITVEPPLPPWNLPDLHQRLEDVDELAVVQMEKPFYEIGSVDGLVELETYLASTPG